MHVFLCPNWRESRLETPPNVSVSVIGLISVTLKKIVSPHSGAGEYIVLSSVGALSLSVTQ